MPIINKIVGAIPPSIIRKLYYSPVGSKLVKLYDDANKNNDRIELYDISDLGFKAYLSPAMPGERAIIYNIFEPEVTALFLSLIKEGSVVFDIGSWVGYYSLVAAAKKAKEVIAVEIDKDNVNRILQNIDANHFDDIIKVLHMGVSNKKGKATVKKGISHLMGKVDNTESGDLSIDTIDSIAAKYETIDLMIMDIEGHELYALEGMTNLLSKKVVKHMIIEVHQKMLNDLARSDDEVIAILTESGYVIQKTVTENPKIYHIHAY